MERPPDQPVDESRRFVCDAMLGGLARWLRAAGHSAVFDVHFADGELVRRAVETGEWLLTSDSGIMQRYAVSQGLARVLYVPRGLSVMAQLAHVFREFDLPLRPSRCMDCNGELRRLDPREAAASVPEKVRQHCKEFFICQGCAKVLWHGTHWLSISRRLSLARRMAGSRALAER